MTASALLSYSSTVMAALNSSVISVADTTSFRAPGVIGGGGEGGGDGEGGGGEGDGGGGEGEGGGGEGVGGEKGGMGQQPRVTPASVGQQLPLRAEHPA